MPWMRACAAGDLDDEDAIRFDHAGRTYALCRSDAGEAFCTDGLCPQDGAHLAGGLVEGRLIECPLHGGVFDLRDGQARDAGGGAALGVYPVRLAGGWVEVDVPD